MRFTCRFYFYSQYEMVKVLKKITACLLKGICFSMLQLFNNPRSMHKQECPFKNALSWVELLCQPHCRKFPLQFPYVKQQPINFAQYVIGMMLPCVMFQLFPFVCSGLPEIRQNSYFFDEQIGWNLYLTSFWPPKNNWI